MILLSHSHTKPIIFFLLVIILDNTKQLMIAQYNLFLVLWQFFIENENAQSFTNTLEIRNMISDLLYCVDLLLQKFIFEEIT